MRTLSSTTARLQSVATQPGQLNQLIAPLRSWWVAYLERRIQREAMLQLHALSDRELRDIGVRRCEIEGVVKSGLECERAFSRHY